MLESLLSESQLGTKKTLASSRKSKLIDIKNLHSLSKKLKNEGKRIVFTLGDFDLLNPAHCRYIAEAKSLGDVLVLGITDDMQVRHHKGLHYPLINQNLRAELVSHLITVDYVVLLEGLSSHGVLALLQPDIFYTSYKDWGTQERDLQEKYLVESFGGKMVVREQRNGTEPYLGTSYLVDHISTIRFFQILSNYVENKFASDKLDFEGFFKPADYGKQIPFYKDAYTPSKKQLDVSDLPKVQKEYKKIGKKTVFVSGSYDLFHTGHSRFIEKAALLGDILIVGIPSDTSLTKLKGLGRPIINAFARSYVLGSMDTVDHVVVFDDLTVRKTLQRLKPDIFFTVDESWNSGLKESPEYEIVTSYGGTVVTAARQEPFLSSSAIINKVTEEKIKEIFKECMSQYV